MLQTIITILVLLIVFGGLFAISLNRSEDKQLKKSCGCSVPDSDGKAGNCVSSCES